MRERERERKGWEQTKDFALVDHVVLRECVQHNHGPGLGLRVMQRRPRR